MLKLAVVVYLVCVGLQPTMLLNDLPARALSFFSYVYCSEVLRYNFVLAYLMTEFYR